MGYSNVNNRTGGEKIDVPAVQEQTVSQTVNNEFIVGVKLPDTLLEVISSGGKSYYSTYRLTVGRQKVVVHVCGELIEQAGNFVLAKIAFWTPPESTNNKGLYIELSSTDTEQATHDSTIVHRKKDIPELVNVGMENMVREFKNEQPLPELLPLMVVVRLSCGGAFVLKAYY